MVDMAAKNDGFVMFCLFKKAKKNRYFCETRLWLGTLDEAFPLVFESQFHPGDVQHKHLTRAVRLFSYCPGDDSQRSVQLAHVDGWLLDCHPACQNTRESTVY